MDGGRSPLAQWILCVVWGRGWELCCVHGSVASHEWLFGLSSEEFGGQSKAFGPFVKFLKPFLNVICDLASHGILGGGAWSATMVSWMLKVKVTRTWMPGCNVSHQNIALWQDRFSQLSDLLLWLIGVCSGAIVHVCEVSVLELSDGPMVQIVTS